MNKLVLAAALVAVTFNTYAASGAASGVSTSEKAVIATVTWHDARCPTISYVTTQFDGTPDTFPGSVQRCTGNITASVRAGIPLADAAILAKLREVCNSGWYIKGDVAFTVPADQADLYRIDETPMGIGAGVVASRIECVPNSTGWIGIDPIDDLPVVRK